MRGRRTAVAGVGMTVSGGGGLARYERQKIDWHVCQADYERRAGQAAVRSAACHSDVVAR
jgi:hypothetical protein